MPYNREKCPRRILTYCLTIKSALSYLRFVSIRPNRQMSSRLNLDGVAPEICNALASLSGIIVMSYFLFAGARRLSIRCKYGRPRGIRYGKYNAVHKLHEGRCTRKGYLQHYSSWRSQHLHA